jgi:hypothetical protein
MDMGFLLLIVLILAVAIIVFLIYRSGDIKRTYTAGAMEGLKRSTASPILTQDDIEHLPAPVQKYLTYAGVIGKEKVQNVRITFDGAMRPDPDKGWAKINAVQYSFFDQPTRLFFMKMRMFGVPIVGLHAYTKAQASMLIKALGLIKVVDSRGPEMRISDTTTMFNDMCLMAPATLIDNRIRWETIDPVTVKATFEIYDTKISATLYFNEKGELINFISDDRYMIKMDNTSRKGRWSTPVKDYKDYNGIKLGSYGEATWLWPEGDYCYGKFNVKNVEYNCMTLK